MSTLSTRDLKRPEGISRDVKGSQEISRDFKKSHGILNIPSKCELPRLLRFAKCQELQIQRIYQDQFLGLFIFSDFPYFKAANPMKILPITPLLPLGISEVPEQISSQESTSNRVADIQHPLDWMLFEVNSSIHLNVQLSILQNWTSGNLFEGIQLLLSICRNPLQVR